MKYIFLLIIFIQSFFTGNAQTDTTTTIDSSTKVIYKVAVLAPIFIDSAFNGDIFKITGNALPRKILPGLDFYNGVMMAIDSLQSEKMPLEILFFDTKSKTLPIKKVLAQKVWDSVSLMIVSFKDRNEIKPLADFAKHKKIPLISATYPNDGGVEDNPYFVLLNSSLRSHCEGIYKYIQKNHSAKNLIYIKRKGKLENDIENIFTEMGELTPSVALKYKTVILSDSFSTNQLRNALDSTKNNVVICGTVNENFGIRLVNSLTALKNYSSIAVGMPTWSGIKDFNKPSMDEITKGIEIIYSTPYNFKRGEGFGKYLTDIYREKFYARASDWFLKGYEITYNFCHLLVKYPTDFITYLASDTTFKIFTDFNIQPILNKNATPSIDYFENKHLYFIKKQDGAIKSIE
ncbi:MAG: hypothetical protein KF781_00595 [Chitinophagaceae bacterium]|nr:hypothetical protein [Chitinophagaceae bacterium]MCW5905233.1 hypothetical protein [Chitinophagaceae bacterium]